MTTLKTLCGAIILSMGCLLLWDKYTFKDIWDEVLEREDRYGNDWKKIKASEKK